MKPHVDTIDVKAMFAIGEKPGFLVLLEFRQTDCAFQRIFEALRFILEDG
jgi:hypothetical protein